MTNRELKSIVEAILFAWSEPLHIDELMKIIDQDKRTTRSILKELQDEFDHYRRGIVINERDDHFQMSTRKEHQEYLAKLIKQSNKKISNSSMEVLAIIAYKQPVTRVEIDNIRGVKSYSSIDTLKAKNLIKEVGKADTIGKPILYATTNEFLRAFDLSSLAELPSIDNLDKLDLNLEDDYDEN